MMSVFTEGSRQQLNCYGFYRMASHRYWKGFTSGEGTTNLQREIALRKNTFKTLFFLFFNQTKIEIGNYNPLTPPPKLPQVYLEASRAVVASICIVLQLTKYP